MHPRLGEENNGLSLSGKAFHILNRVFDEAIGLAIQTFATQQALEVQRRRDEYLAFVTHDLRTPLNAIALATRILELETTTNRTGANVETYGSAAPQHPATCNFKKKFFVVCLAPLRIAPPRPSARQRRPWPTLAHAAAARHARDAGRLPPRAVRDGTVLVEVALTAAAVVRDLKVLSPPSAFDSAALETVKGWRFGFPSEPTGADQVFVYAVVGFREPITP